jgi:hypothetical protein
MKLPNLWLAMITLGVCAYAEPVVPTLPSKDLTFTTLDGREFKNARIIRVVGPRVEVATVGSLLLVNIVDLPANLRTQFAAALAAATRPKLGEIISFQARNGQNYKDVWLRRIEPSGITVETANGLVNVPFANMPDEWVQRFDYDASRAAQFEAQRAAAEYARKVREAAEAAAAAQASGASAGSGPAPATSNAPALGEQGSRNLGAPRLGGAGLGR